MIAQIPIVTSFHKMAEFPRHLVVNHIGVLFRRLMRPTFSLWFWRLRCDSLIFGKVKRQISYSIIARKLPRSL